MRNRPGLGLIIVIFIAAWASPVAAQRFATNGPYQQPAGGSPTAEWLSEIGFDQHLDAPLPLDATFRDETNHAMPLRDRIGGKPVILALVYYRCPMLCTQVLNGVFQATQAMPLEMGQDYDVIAVSIDPEEPAELAAEKRRQYLRSYRHTLAEGSGHFLTGDSEAIDQLAKAVGFRYRLDPATKQFAHASGIVVVTPDGRISRYFFGIEYDPRDLRLALVESSSGRIGSLADQALLLCYHYDPLTGKYGLVISRVLCFSGLLTVACLGAFLCAMWRIECRRPKLDHSVVTTEAP